MRRRLPFVNLLILLVLAACMAPSPNANSATRSVAPGSSTEAATPSDALDSSAIVCDPAPMVMKVDAQGRRSEVRITLACDAAVRVAMRVVPAWPPLRQVEFHYGRWCPPGAYCALSSFDMGYVVFHLLLGAPDAWVPVQLEVSGEVTLGGPLAPWPPPSLAG